MSFTDKTACRPIVDEFGFSKDFFDGSLQFLSFLTGEYFRAEVHGIENLPDSGRAIIAANHGGILPWDAVVIQNLVFNHHHERRLVRPLMEDYIFYLPYVNIFMNRLGAVRACQENAEKLLLKEEIILTFPEGLKGVGKSFTQKYVVQRFGRGGLVKLALRTRTSVIPVAVKGSEESHPLLFKSNRLGKIFNIPFFPFTLTFPALGPLGLIPLPAKWSVAFGKPFDFHNETTADFEDPVIVAKYNEEVRSTIQAMLKETR
ncbi:MAG: acyltransferase family protein [Deltaproteobacteria bacterium]|nr:acyltransferase family protein [Deltaproteobacteria bacterium]